MRLIPDGDAGIEARMLDRVFDNYVMTPMQKIVLDKRRPESGRDSYGVTEARGFLDDIYAWLDARLTDRVWAVRGPSTKRDPTVPTSRSARPIATDCSW